MRALIAPALLGLTAVAGCAGPSGYLAEQAWGQLKILHNRQRIDRMLRKPDLKPEVRVKLKLVQLVREYAHETIGLRKTGAYTRFYDTGGKPLAHNLSACPPDSLKPKVWRFPIVGGLPYLGFFEKRKFPACAYFQIFNPSVVIIGNFDSTQFDILFDAVEMVIRVD